MARSGPRGLPPAERRRRIEQAATELFATVGYDATTVDDIVAAAGLTKPMLYRHFESKQELFISLLERYRDQLAGAPLSSYDAEAAERRGQIDPLIVAWLGHTREHPDATRLLFGRASGDTEVERAQRDIHARQRATLTALVREFAPGLTGTDAELAGAVTHAGLAAVALWWIEHPDIPGEIPVGVLSRMVHGLIDVREGDSTRIEAQ